MTTPANPQEILSLARNLMECRVLLTGFKEIQAGLAEAGFEKIGLIQEKDQMMGLVEAFRPI